MVSVLLMVVSGTNHSPVHFGLPRVAKNFLDLRLALYRVQLVLVVMGLVELVVLRIACGLYQPCIPPVHQHAVSILWLPARELSAGSLG